MNSGCECSSELSPEDALAAEAGLEVVCVCLMNGCVRPRWVLPERGALAVAVGDWLRGAPALAARWPDDVGGSRRRQRGALLAQLRLAAGEGRFEEMNRWGRRLEVFDRVSQMRVDADGRELMRVKLDLRSFGAQLERWGDVEECCRFWSRLRPGFDDGPLSAELVEVDTLVGSDGLEEAWRSGGTVAFSWRLTLDAVCDDGVVLLGPHVAVVPVAVPWPGGFVAPPAWDRPAIRVLR